MSENSLKETVTRLATPLVQAQGLEIWGVEIAQAGRTTVREIGRASCRERV